jgi:hypothetical protein
VNNIVVDRGEEEEEEKVPKQKRLKKSQGKFSKII